MGLDMYLTAKRYLRQYPENGNDAKIAKAIGDLPIGNHGMRVKEVSCEAIYWRKANAIHAWFVRECQGGRDECQTTWVSREKLQELLTLCKETFETKDASKLPPQSGFFFGSTEYDEGYFYDIRETRDILKKVLKPSTINNWKISYQSSW